MNIRELLKNPYVIFISLLGRGIHFKKMPDKLFLKILFHARTGKKLNLKNPQTFNEKLQWIKLYDRNPEYTRMVDKYEVKAYIRERIGEEYIIPTLGVWDRFEDIDFDKLPDQFVIKCTHDSGGLVICKDKSKLDLEAVNKKVTRCLKRNYYYANREWPYKNVRPRVLAEKYMVDESGTELKDYKVLCFNGEAKLIQMHSGRYDEVHMQDYYDTQWNYMDVLQGYPNSGEVCERPEFLEEMLELSQKLSAGIPHVRVDWYYVENHLYFGELTFFDGSGCCEFEPDEYNKIVGDWITLPKK